MIMIIIIIMMMIIMMMIITLLRDLVTLLHIVPGVGVVVFADLVVLGVADALGDLLAHVGVLGLVPEVLVELVLLALFHIFARKTFEDCYI